jgi:hypothetical protein
VVHLNASGLPLRRYLIEVQIPPPCGRLPKPPRRRPAGTHAPTAPVPPTTAPLGAQPAQRRAARASVIIPQEFNYLLNPAHPDAAQITAVDHGRFVYDARLLGR